MLWHVQCDGSFATRGDALYEQRAERATAWTRTNIGQMSVLIVEREEERMPCGLAQLHTQCTISLMMVAQRASVSMR